MTESSRGASLRPSSNNTPSSPPSVPGIKRKSLTEEKYDYKLPIGILNDSILSPLVISGDLKMGGVSGDNGYINSHTLSQQDQDSNTGGVSIGNGFMNSPTIIQFNYSCTFKEMYK